MALDFLSETICTALVRTWEGYIWTVFLQMVDHLVILQVNTAYLWRTLKHILIQHILNIPVDGSLSEIVSTVGTSFIFDVPAEYALFTEQLVTFAARDWVEQQQLANLT